MPRPSDRALRVLLGLNLVLQLLDGTLTYLGLQAGLSEGNPLLRWAFGVVGPVTALCLFKLEACACLLVVWRLRHNHLAAPALAASALLYVGFALVPWTAALAAAHFTYSAS